MMSNMADIETKHVIIFDGTCSFCRVQIDRIQRRDKFNKFEYVPRQTPDLEIRFPRLNDSDFKTGMRLVSAEGQFYVGADAVYQIVQQLPGWRRIAWLYRIPGIHGLARWIYSCVASRRQSLGTTCENEMCTVPED